MAKKEQNSSVYDVIKLIGATNAIDEVQKKFKLAASTTDIIARRSTCVSSGLLVTDLMLNGGIYPGGWYTSLGPEASGKSTLMLAMLTAFYHSDVPVVMYYDPENAMTPEYLVRITKNGVKGKEVDLKNMFGVRNPKTNKWEIEPRVWYSSESSLESIWMSISATLKRLPDKVYIDNEWYLLFDRTKENISKFKGQNISKIGDQFGKIAVKSLDGGAPQALFIIDSYPMMTTDSSDEDEGDNALAVDARAHSKHVKKVKGKLKRKHATVIGVNQLRQAIAVGFSAGPNEYEPCFTSRTPVLLADGTVDTIRNIVLKKRKVKVLSFDPETGKVSAKRIIDWKNNGYKPIEDIITVTYNSYDMYGRKNTSSVTCTKNHKFWTDTGWKKAENLTVDDTLYINMVEDTYSSDQMQVLYGSLLGDGVFHSDTGSLKFGIHYTHVRYQVPYMLWKASMIDYGDPHTIFNDSTIQRYAPRGKESSYKTLPLYNKVIAKYASVLRSNHINIGKKEEKIISKILSKIDLRGLAIWYQDDGHWSNDFKNGQVITITCDRFTPKLKYKAIERIKELTQSDALIDQTNGKITIKGKENILTFLNAVAPYVHQSMSYKLFNTFNCSSYEWSTTDPIRKNRMVRSKLISLDKPDIESKSVQVFDLTIEDNHTYFVGGATNSNAIQNKVNTRTNRGIKADCIAVSNCGQALKYASDSRIRVAARSVPHGKGAFEEEDSVEYSSGVDTYRYVCMRAQKNKYGTPNLEVWARLWVSDPEGQAHGYCPVYDCYQYLTLTNQVEGSLGRGLTIKLKNGWTSPKLKWLEFKALVLLTGKELKEFCAKMKIDKNPKLRQTCFEQIKSGLGTDLYYATMSGLNEESYSDWTTKEIIAEVVERELLEKKVAKKESREDLIKLLEADDIGEDGE